MNLSERERRELSDLASAAADGSITAQDATRLEELLLASPEARAFYVRFMDVSAGMAWAARAEPEVPVAGKIEAGQTQARGWKLATAAVAMLAIASLTALTLNQTRKPVASAPSAAGIATLSTAVNVQWADDLEPTHVGNMLQPGWVRIKSGLAQIDFISGASVWLEGPVEFRLDSPREGYCAAGKLVAHVPGGTNDFRIAAPYMSSIENASGFGLEVNKGSKAALHVFRGTVEVTLQQNVGKRQIGAGQALAVDHAGEASMMFADPAAFSRQEFAGSWTGMGSGAWGNPGGPGWGSGGGWGGGGGWGAGNRSSSMGPDYAHQSAAFAMPPSVMLPGQWKGADPMDPVRDLMGVNEERWQLIKKPLENFLSEQWKNWGFDNNPEEKGVSRAKWDLKFAVENPNSSDEELASRVKSLREAREASRKILSEKELAIRALLTDEEQSKLVNWGYIP